METVKSEIVGVLWAMLPGFVAAWVYYGLTAHRKQSQFERTVQAVIFTGLILPFVLTIKIIANGIAQRYLDFGAWDANVQATWGVIVGLLLGLVISYYANNSKVHSWLSKLNITKRTSFPSEWFSAFGMDQRWILLHLEDGRRLYGWPYENPDHPDAGHFVMMKAEWILPDNTRVPLDTTHRVLIPAAKVAMVEFDKDPSEYTHDRAKHEEAVRVLVKLNKEANEKEDTKPNAKDGSDESANARRMERSAVERLPPTDGEPN